MSDDRLWEDGQTASVFRPSYSATSLFCAGSLIPSMSAVDTAGYDAAVGTVFHELIAHWQLNGRPDDWLGDKRTIINGEQAFVVEVDDEMFTCAEECLSRFSDFPGDRYVETRVDISDLTPLSGQGGTCDLAFCEMGVLDITDWKYGKGVQVFAARNTQLLCYAWGFFQEFDKIYGFHTIRLRIAQPRLNHWDLWEISRDELLAFADWARERWALAWKPNADRTPGPKQCQWCKVRLPCAALEAVRQAMADDTFEVLDVSHETQKALVVADPKLKPPVSLSTDQLARIYTYRKIMEAWFQDIHEELISRGFQGDDLGGLWKVANGRPGNRKWVDEEVTAEALCKVGVDDELIYQRRLVSPAQAEKLVRAAGVKGKLGPQYINLFTDRAPGRPTLVPIGDNRGNVASIVDDSFEGEDDPEAV